MNPELIEILNKNRRLDGLPNLTDKQIENLRLSQLTPLPDSDSDDLLLLLETEESVYMTNTKRNNVVEARLSAYEKELFRQAKQKALQPWIDNDAWQAVDPSEAAAGEICPMRFLLKWKLKDGNYEANARIIIQGFQLQEVTSVHVDKKSPTLSRTSRSVLLMTCVTLGWKLLVADVKSPSCSPRTFALTASVCTASRPRRWPPCLRP